MSKILIEVEAERFGAFADCDISDFCRKNNLRVIATREINRNNDFIKPSCLGHKDNIDNCIKRAFQLSSYGSYSGMLCENKDLRRIVLMANYIKYLESKLEKCAK